MKNINTYILTAIVSLILVVATSFLMTAADETIRQDRKSTRLNSSHDRQSRMPSSA